MCKTCANDKLSNNFKSFKCKGQKRTQSRTVNRAYSCTNLKRAHMFTRLLALEQTRTHKIVKMPISASFLVNAVDYVLSERKRLRKKLNVLLYWIHSLGLRQ